MVVLQTILNGVGRPHKPGLDFGASDPPPRFRTISICDFQTKLGVESQEALRQSVLAKFVSLIGLDLAIDLPAHKPQKGRLIDPSEVQGCSVPAV